MLRPVTAIVLDCDPGHDDAFAMMLAAAHPRIELLSITTVAGNQTLPKTTLNARRVATVAGITGVPIAAGADRPLHGALQTAPDIHGTSGLDGPGFGEPTVPLSDLPAVALLRETILARPDPVTVVAVGPLTNIATLLLAHPECAERIERIALMGGSTGRGNVTPYAEFNIYVDPVAADIVFNSGLPITMVGLNVSHQALAEQAVLDRISAIGGPLSAICVELLGFFRDAYRGVYGFTAPPVHDPITVATLIEPSILSTRRARVNVELAGEFTRGATVVDFQSTEPNCDVGEILDVPAFWDLMVDAIATLSR
jgi:purine nucleosidase/pyrimidine-specific ribonucleoside hydrolase